MVLQAISERALVRTMPEAMKKDELFVKKYHEIGMLSPLSSLSDSVSYLFKALEVTVLSLVEIPRSFVMMMASPIIHLVKTRQEGDKTAADYAKIFIYHLVTTVVRPLILALGYLFGGIRHGLMNQTMLETSVESLQDKNRLLGEQIEALKVVKASLENQKQLLERMNERFKVTEQELNGEIAQLRDNIGKAQKKNTQSEKKVRESETKITDLMKQLVQLNELKELAKTNGTLSQKGKRDRNNMILKFVNGLVGVGEASAALPAAEDEPFATAAPSN